MVAVVTCSNSCVPIRLLKLTWSDSIDQHVSMSKRKGGFRQHHSNDAKHKNLGRSAGSASSNAAPTQATRVFGNAGEETGSIRSALVKHMYIRMYIYMCFSIKSCGIDESHARSQTSKFSMGRQDTESILGDVQNDGKQHELGAKCVGHLAQDDAEEVDGFTRACECPIAGHRRLTHRMQH